MAYVLKYCIWLLRGRTENKRSFHSKRGHWNFSMYELSQSDSRRLSFALGKVGVDRPAVTYCGRRLLIYVYWRAAMSSLGTQSTPNARSVWRPWRPSTHRSSLAVCKHSHLQHAALSQKGQPCRMGTLRVSAGGHYVRPVVTSVVGVEPEVIVPENVGRSLLTL